VRLRETAGAGDDGDGDIPEVLVLVVLFEPDAAVLGLTDIRERQPARFGFAEQEVEADACQFRSSQRLFQFRPRDHDRLDDPGRDLRDADSTRLACGAVDLNRLAEWFHDTISGAA